MGLIVYDHECDENDCCDDPNVSDCGEGDVTNAYDDDENYCDYGNDDVEDMMLLMFTKTIMMILIVVTIMKVILTKVVTMVAIIC